MKEIVLILHSGASAFSHSGPGKGVHRLATLSGTVPEDEATY